MTERYRQSEAFLSRTLQSVPLGAQTFSKSTLQYPVGISPLFAIRVQGSHLRDLDGNEYVDYVMGLCAVNLGYADPDVNAAVAAQLQDAVILSLSHPLECAVAEKMAEIVPCAEQVRFGKNGSDATSGAVRLARAATGRDHILCCGYHGWQDWYIGSTVRHAGVPDAVRALTHPFPYNDPDALHRLFHQFSGQVAAVIMEPANVVAPVPGFLENVRELAHDKGALLIFDETITGFRFANGGAQQLFGVVPDLAVFGKGMANGFPLSAVAGPARLMRWMEEIFFSFTFGGEVLSLAAALATMNKLQQQPVIAKLWDLGKRVQAGVAALIAQYALEDVLSVAGLPPWSFLMFKPANGIPDLEIKTLFLQEVWSRGILTLGTHNLSYAHTAAEIDDLLLIYNKVFEILAEGVRSNTVRKMLKSEPLVPVFRVR